MTKYPSVTGKKLLKCLLRKGYLKVRQNGSHVFLRHPDDPMKHTVIQNIKDDLSPPMINCIRRQLKLSRKEYLKILKDC